jgi:hypothetical protein
MLAILGYGNGFCGGFQSFHFFVQVFKVFMHFIFLKADFCTLPMIILRNVEITFYLFSEAIFILLSFSAFL